MFGLLAIGSVVPLATAFCAQYIFDFHPCEMCLVERVPYALVALLMLIVWKNNALKIGLLVAIALWAIESLIGFYHVGIEQSWWDSATGCVANSSAGASLEDLKAAIMNGPIVSCRDVTIRVLGLSLASWNVIYALGLVACGTICYRKLSK